MDRELVEKFMEVTGESEAVAAQYLALADGNVETAIILMFENPGGAREPESNEQEPEIRPPILPTQEILVPSEPEYSFPRLSNNVFDRFRDFAVETQRQEEEMTRRVTGIKQISQRKSKRLEDLFRPPSDILFSGSFIEAREHAKTLNRWLLVNIQNSEEFACQVLNRDVWPNQQIQEIVKDHFVLWQVLSSTTDGKRYIDFYNVMEYPYLAIIDPRTGECMRTYKHITVDILISALSDMLSTHASPESAPEETSNSKGPTTCATTSMNKGPNSMINDCSSTSKNLENATETFTGCVNNTGPHTLAGSFKVMNKRRRMEEEQLREQCLEANVKENDRFELKPETSRDKTSNDSPVRLCLRLPNGKKETIIMYSTNTIEDFLNKMEAMGYASSDHTYLVPFPKTNIGALLPETHLSDTILSPASTVFITKM